MQLRQTMVRIPSRRNCVDVCLQHVARLLLPIGLAGNAVVDPVDPRRLEQLFPALLKSEPLVLCNLAENCLSV